MTDQPSERPVNQASGESAKPPSEPSDTLLGTVTRTPLTGLSAGMDSGIAAETRPCRPSPSEAPVSGYLYVYRSLFDHRLWNDKPFAMGQAWLDLIGLAAYAPHDITIKFRTYHLERGDVLMAGRVLADRWGWSLDKVQRFLKLLEAEKMVARRNAGKSGHEIGHLTICNYEIYQQPCDTARSRIGHESVTNRSIISKGKEGKQGNKVDGEGEPTLIDVAPSSRFKPPTVEEVAAYCRERSNGIDPEAFVAHYQMTKWHTSGGAAVKDWKAAIVTWEKRDKSRAPGTTAQPPAPKLVGKPAGQEYAR